MQTPAPDAIRKSALQDMAACADIQRVWRAILQTWNTHDQSESAQVLSNALVDLARRGALSTAPPVPATLKNWPKGRTRSTGLSSRRQAKLTGLTWRCRFRPVTAGCCLVITSSCAPFSMTSFAACFNQLRGEAERVGVIGILDELGRKPGNARLIDIEWLKEKLDADANWAKSFPNYAQRWLASFESIFEGRRESSRALLKISPSALP